MLEAVEWVRHKMGVTTQELTEGRLQATAGFGFAGYPHMDI